MSKKIFLLPFIAVLATVVYFNISVKDIAAEERLNPLCVSDDLETELFLVTNNYSFINSDMLAKSVKTKANKGETEKDTWLCIKEEYYNAKTGEIYNQTFYDYTENGLLVESRSGAGNSKKTFSRYTYDKNKNCILQSDYSFDTLVSDTVFFEKDIEYSYSKKNELVKEKHYYTANNDLYSEEYLYEKGMLKEKRKYEGTNLSSNEVYEYTSEGLLKEKDSYIGTKLQSKEVYEYSDGVLIKIESSYESDWSYITTHHFEYDSEGNIIKEWYESSGDTTPDLIITYEYNERGEKIRCINDYSDYHNNASGDDRQRDLFYSYEYDKNGNLTKEKECDESWNPVRITEYSYINKKECVSHTTDDFIGLYRLGFNDGLNNEAFLNLVRLKQGGNLDEIQCSYNVSGTYSEKIEILLDINGMQFRDVIDFIDSSDLAYLYAVDLNISDKYGNVVAVLEGEDDNKKSIIYAYDKNGITKVGEMKGEMDIHNAAGDSKITTNEALVGGTRSLGKFIAHRSGEVNGLLLLEGETTVGYFSEIDNEKIYQDGFSFYSNGDLTVYQEPGSEQSNGVIPAGSEIILLKYTVTDVIYHDVTVTDDAFFVSGGGVSGWTTNGGIREVAEDYYAVG